MIARDGASSARMLDIAREAGITSSGLLHHFGSRHNLLVEALVQKDERWLVDLDRFARDHGPAQQMSHAIDVLLNPPPAEREAWRRDWSVWFEAWTLALHDDRVATVCRAQERRWTHLFADMISAGFDSGEFTASSVLPTISKSPGSSRKAMACGNTCSIVATAVCIAVTSISYACNHCANTPPSASRSFAEV